jgi:hypothetical protein
MKKFFNIAGPCNIQDHYKLPLLNRNKEVMQLIDEKQYFVIHAARQSGKTTLLQELASEMEANKKYYVLYCSLESAYIFNEPDRGIPEIFHLFKSAIKYSSLPFKEEFGKDIDLSSVSTIIGDSFKDFCSKLDKPLILFIDEIDCLEDRTLVGFLRQLRDGYITRIKIPFLHSVVLVGMRNIRDFKSKIKEGKEALGSVSPFNIITKSLTLMNFSTLEIEKLFSQHTVETGQIFENEVIEKVFEETNGQPWLVNAIAREAINEVLKNDHSQKIKIETIEKAIQNIILRRDTHIDSLLERLKEERVKKVMEPIIIGTGSEVNIQDDDTQYCLDLGLIRMENGTLIPSNRIYSEVIIRTLTYNTQFHLETQVENIWIHPDGNIDMNGLLKGFQEFWRENSGIWLEKYEYKEAAPHLILQAFLQRIINGGGQIHREYASDKGRIDLCVFYKKKKYPIELKILYSPSTIKEGIKQLAQYLDKVGEKVGWLVLFDRDIRKSWSEKLYWKNELMGDSVIHMVGC